MEIGYKQALRIIVRDRNGRPVAELLDKELRALDGYTIEVERPEREYSTLEEIAAISKPYIIPRQAASFMGCHPHSINEQAKLNAEALGFPVCVLGTEVRIPKAAFIKFWGGEISEKT